MLGRDPPEGYRAVRDRFADADGDRLVRADRDGTVSSPVSPRAVYPSGRRRPYPRSSNAGERELGFRRPRGHLIPGDASQDQHPSDGDRSLASRVFGVGLRRETYANLAYLLAHFPLGVAYFVTFVAGLSIGLSLAPLVVGVPILVGVLALAGYVGVLEAHLLRGLRGSSVSYDPADLGDQPLSTYAKSVVTNPRNYLLVAYALATFVVGVHLFNTNVEYKPIVIRVGTTPKDFLEVAN